MTRIYERTYYSDETPSRVATFWINRRRENGATVWNGGVTFGTHADGYTTTTAFDGKSWTTALSLATRATKRRDNAACATLYDLALTHITTPDVLKDMGVYEYVCFDSDNRTWE